MGRRGIEGMLGKDRCDCGEIRTGGVGESYERPHHALHLLAELEREDVGWRRGRDGVNWTAGTIWSGYGVG